MRILPALVAFILVASGACAQLLNYPPTKTVDAAETYHGQTYKDPYRWLEDLKSKDVEAWFKAQAELTDRTLATIPGRQKLADEWMALDKLRPASYRDIVVEAGRVFYKKTLGGENVGKLYVRDGYAGPEKLLFDPTTYTKAGNTTLQNFIPSWDAKHVVIGLSAGGAEYSELRVLNVADGTLSDEKIYPSYGPGGWTPNGGGFFYDAGKTTDIKSLDIELNRKTRLHRLGTPVAADTDFFSNESYPQLGIAPKESPAAMIDESCPEHLLGWVQTVQAETRLYVASVEDLYAPAGKVNWKPLCKLSDNIVRGTALHGEYVYGITHTDAPRYKVVRTKIADPDWAHAETVIPQADDSVQSLVKCRHYLLVTYSNGVVGRLVKYDLATGKASDVKLPASGTVDVACPDWKDDLCHVVVTSWTQPPTRYDFDAKADALAKSVFNVDVTYPGFEDLVAEEVEAESHDGTKVPLSIIHKKGLALDGSHPCILEGYGAYGYSINPHFDLKRSVAARGVVFAIAHVRGGSENGEAWYKAGYKTTKPNTWKDFIACGEYLVKHGYTRPEHLAGTGTSAGGILISRAITERPDLFRAAVCNVGCANALRMEFSPNGPPNVPEFGTVEDAAECRALAEMDGVAHVRAGVNYPAVLGVAGWNDPRVTPWEPGKFVAAVQNASTSSHPALLKVNYDDGHFTEEKRVTFSNFAAQYAFMLWQTGHPDFQPEK